MRAHRLRAGGAGLMLSVLLSAGAFAQGPSTGNPRGSIAPATEGSDANPPANPARTIAPGPSGSRPSGKAPPEARGQRPAESSNKEGNVTGSGTGDPSRRDRQDNTMVPMPPPRKAPANTGPGR